MPEVLQLKHLQKTKHVRFPAQNELGSSSASVCSELSPPHIPDVSGPGVFWDAQERPDDAQKCPDDAQKRPDDVQKCPHDA